MATTKFYLDTRSVHKGNPAPLKLAITKKGSTALIGLNISLHPEQWDKKKSLVLAHPQKQFLNTYITKRKLDADLAILKLIETGEIGAMCAKDIKNRINSELSGKDTNTAHQFITRFNKYAESQNRNSTKELYRYTVSRICKFTAQAEQLTFEDITKDWLADFDNFLSKTSPSKNARNIHLRNIRAVFNDAIDDEVTTFYPFRKFKIKGIATAKRSLTLEQLGELFSYKVEKHTEKYLDMFKLIFYLIGINIIDLCNLKEVNNGRIEYYRAKTGRLYSIKVEPEAMEIIGKYKGENWLLDILDRYGNHKDYAKRLNDNLQQIGEIKRVGRGGKKIHQPLFPKLTTYWARHTWATIAAELDIPKETIAAALGHSIGNPITSIYIDFNTKKIDEANRRVIDYVLHKKM